MLRVWLISLIMACCSAMSASAQNRLALVIGNDAYSDVPALRKAVNDAEAIAAELAARGFDVMTAIDADRREMNRHISRFTAKLEPGDTALLFFAGHGVEIDGENYLLPVDIVSPAAGEQDFIKAESIALSSLLDRIRTTGAKVTLAFIDACRDNPFASTTGRSIGRTRGLGRISAPEGTFVVFSAGAGQMALDELVENEPERNSVFTRTLLRKLPRPGLELRELVKEVRIEVRNSARSVDHAQFPAYYDELLGEFYFAGRLPTAAEITPDPPASPDDMQSDFATALERGTADALEGFLTAYAADNPDAPSVTAARALLIARRAETEAADRETEPTPVGSGTSAPASRVDRREHIRLVQRELNRLGCDAGAADGQAGAKTKRAFARAIAAADLPLRPQDLSDADTLPETLAVLGRVSGTVCREEIAAKPTEPNPPEPDTTSQPTGVDISGTWYVNSSCPLFVETTGRLEIEHVNGAHFEGFFTDSLDQQANSIITVDGLDVRTSDDFGWITTSTDMRLAPDGNSATGSSSTFCDVEWRRAG